MKILVPGIEPDKQTFIGQCPNCRCIFEFERGDISRSGNIECPHCHWYNSKEDCHIINTSISIQEYYHTYQAEHSREYIHSVKKNSKLPLRKDL